jgi:hypothetical protein
MSTRTSRLDEDREQADDDREDAEAFCEGREDDRDAADLAGRVGLRPMPGRQAAEDADADAGADDPEGGESGADVLHVVSSSYSPGLRPGSSGTVVGAPSGASVGGLERGGSDPWMARAPPRRRALLVLVALDGEDDEHERQDAEDERLDRVEHDLEAEQADRDEAMVSAVMTPSATSPP